ncbi:MAG: hypothetical protein CM1200mP27_11750 [Chloroflexota bacterium]|nr:MAG: hypothetical protein CM1200mP27_11750 [Chloroflexota bacterium]
MGLEMVQQLGWKMPDAVIYPTGGGTGIIGMYKGFQRASRIRLDRGQNSPSSFQCKQMVASR